MTGQSPKTPEDLVRTADRKYPGIQREFSPCILTLDKKGTILEADQYILDMLKYGADELPALTWGVLTPAEYRTVEDAQLSAIFTTGKGAMWTKEFLARDGERFPCMISGSLVPGCSDRAVFMLLDSSSVTRAEQEAQKLAGRLLNLYDEERRRIARELHDTTAQNLAALAMNMAMLTGNLDDRGRTRAILDECSSLTEECLREVRSLSYMLHPPLLDELGLEPALRIFIDLYQRRTGVEVEMAVANQIGRFNPEKELSAFRIAQEGLFNIHRHSKSTRALVSISRTGPKLELSVRDWGIGIDPESITGDSLGIAGMRERARLMGAEFEISLANPGTLIRAVFRLEQ